MGLREFLGSTMYQRLFRTSDLSCKIKELTDLGARAPAVPVE
jgi:hypothetical protein